MNSTLGQSAEKLSIILPERLNNIIRTQIPEITLYEDYSVIEFTTKPTCTMDDAMDDLSDGMDMYLVHLSRDNNTGFMHGCYMTDPCSDNMLKADFITDKEGYVTRIVICEYESIDCLKDAIDRELEEHVSNKSIELQSEMLEDVYNEFFS